MNESTKKILKTAGTCLIAVVAETAGTIMKENLVNQVKEIIKK